MKHVTSNKHLKVLRDDPGQRSRQLLIRGTMYHVKKNTSKISTRSPSDVFLKKFNGFFCSLVATVMDVTKWDILLEMVMMRNLGYCTRMIE